MIVWLQVRELAIFFWESERRYGSGANRDVRNVAAGCGLAFVGKHEMAGPLCRHGGDRDGGAGDRGGRAGDWRGQGAEACAGDRGRGADEGDTDSRNDAE